jgi:periplasmic protein TonB
MARMIRLSIVALLVVTGIVTARAQGDEALKPGPGVTLPKPTFQQKPQYTKEAMDARIQGTVLLSMVVQKDGSVGRVDVARSLDAMYGLDESAVSAARQWRFEPGQKDGKPVAVEVQMEMTFTLRERQGQ